MNSSSSSSSSSSSLYRTPSPTPTTLVSTTYLSYPPTAPTAVSSATVGHDRCHSLLLPAVTTLYPYPFHRALPCHCTWTQAVTLCGSPVPLSNASSVKTNPNPQLLPCPYLLLLGPSPATPISAPPLTPLSPPLTSAPSPPALSTPSRLPLAPPLPVPASTTLMAMAASSPLFTMPTFLSHLSSFPTSLSPAPTPLSLSPLASLALAAVLYLSPLNSPLSILL